MMIRRSVSAVVTLLLCVPGSVAAQEPLVLLPNSPWNVEYAPESCILARAFGPTADSVYLRMEQFEPGAMVEVSLVGSPLRSRKVTDVIQLAFSEGPGLRPITTSALFGKTNDGKPALNFLLSLREATGGDTNDLAELTAAEFNALTDLRVALVKDATQVVFKTGNMSHALAAMKVCMDKLLTQWGMDPVKLKSLIRRPEPLNAGRWIRSEDYPKGAMHAGRSANVHFRLNVDEEGRVSDCSIQNTTEGVDFARRTCSVISRRGRFQPALDANGQPASSYYVNTVQWLMNRGQSKGTRLAAEVFDDIN